MKPSKAQWVNGKIKYRDYVDMPGSPLWPFGYGLSYTKFEYSNLRVSPGEIGPAGVVRVSAEITNTGAREGQEVAQLYIQDVVSSVTRPIEELKGFQKVALKPGERKTVEFTLGFDELSFLNRGLDRVVEPGTFRVMIGSSCQDIRLDGRFEVKAL
jgi:beta-glucosidase